MAVLQVFQANLFCTLDEAGPDPEAFKDMRSATDMALRATKTTAQAIGRNMAVLTVMERHLWLTLTDMKDTDKSTFLDSPTSSTSLFGPSVKGFAEHFTEAQKASQAMQHFLPKHFKKPPPSQTSKLPPSAFQPRPAAEARHRSHLSSRRRPGVIITLLFL